MSTSFRFEIVDERPVLDLSPQSTRMVAAYLDRAERCHVFTDVIDPARDTPFPRLSSWDAEIAHYVSNDLASFERRDAAVLKGRWRGREEDSDLDCIGAASPGVAVADGRVWLVYAGRGPADLDALRALEGEAVLHLPGRIMLASAPTDARGAPANPFSKHGVAVERHEPWAGFRLDDPCPVLDEDGARIFHKGIGGGESGERAERVVCLAETEARTPLTPCEPRSQPVLRVDGGAEMPRVFRADGRWQMFLKRFRPTGLHWEHYEADAAAGPWRLVTDRLFDGAGSSPETRGPRDMCPIWEPFGSRPPRYALAVGLDDGRFGDRDILKQWLYRMLPVEVPIR